VANEDKGVKRGPILNAQARHDWKALAALIARQTGSDGLELVQAVVMDGCSLTDLAAGARERAARGWRLRRGLAALASAARASRHRHLVGRGCGFGTGPVGSLRNLQNQIVAPGVALGDFWLFG
jgi:hypothetical protein